MITNISILDTIQASGADAVNSNGNLIVSGLPNALRLTVDNSTYKKTLYTAGTAGTWVATFPAGAAGDVVTVNIKSIPAIGNPITTTVNYVVSGTLAAAANGAAFVVAANAAAVAKAAALGISVPFVASGTTTVTLTGQTSALQIVGTIKYQPNSAYLTSVVNTIGTNSFGTAAMVTALGGVLNTSGVAFTGSAYTLYKYITVRKSNTANYTEIPVQNFLWLNSTLGANYTTLVNRLDYIFAADVTYTEAINEAIAVV